MSKFKLGYLVVLLLTLFLFSQCNHKDDSDVSDPPPVSYPNYGNLVRPLIDHDFQNVEVDIQLLADALAWRDFIALNWPASQDTTQRGVPDLGNRIGGLPVGGISPVIQPNGPTVWETYKSTNDVFLTKPYRVPNPSFNVPPIIPSNCDDGRVLSRRTKISDVVSDSLEAFSGKPLIDQNGNDVWYEVLYNETAFDYVIHNQFYNKNKQKGAYIDFPSGNNETTESGAMRVKAAWKIFDWETEGFKKDYFYLSKAYVDNVEAGTCDTVTLALVGLHIVHKIKSRPEWVWGSFEHMYNCPDSLGWPALPKGWTKYNFNDPSKGGPYNVPPTSGSAKPVQVQRTVPIPEEVKEINESYQNLMRNLRSDNVWQYYMLVNTQWPSNPTDTVNYGVPQPVILANTVLETYFQGPTINEKIPHSCMGCHGKYASHTDFGFQLQGASSPSDVETTDPTEPTFFSLKTPEDFLSPNPTPFDPQEIETIREFVEAKK